ncbi:hypothetical protein NLG97_g5192 [Lecanicillium saksenae]|uniref:Uncharacterized protein n=1 Tax=Lecanicillium saksenae TaxID=468837 RepID=A0ACC1QT70_9HYPO|nr:hypothetical protein NLG97_g5192 [Lecanicillium saksenae]
MESQNGLGKLLPKSLSARRKQRSKKAKTRDGAGGQDEGEAAAQAEGEDGGGEAELEMANTATMFYEKRVGEDAKSQIQDSLEMVGAYRDQVKKLEGMLKDAAAAA